VSVYDLALPATPWCRQNQDGEVARADECMPVAEALALRRRLAK
jgi:hypothetical protein